MKWLEEKQSKTIITLVTWVFFGCALVWMLKALFLGLYPDFSVYYYGSKFYLAGQNPYLSGQKLFSGYSYPPIVFLLFVPFTFLSFQNSEMLWVFLNILFLFASIILLTKIFSLKFFSNVNLILSGFIFISFPVKFTLGMGQVNILILLLLVISLFLLKKKQEFYSGLFLGLSLGIKIFPLLLPLYFLQRKKQKLLLGLLSCVAILIIMVLVFVPLKTYLYFVQNVVPYFFSASWKLEYYSQSLSAFVGRTFGTGGWGSMVKNASTLVIIAITFFTTIRVREKNFLLTSLVFGYLIVSTMLINTFSWQHHYVWLIIPFYTIIIYLMENKGKKWEFLIVAISYFLISTNFKNPQAVSTLIQSHIFFGTLLLFILETKILLDSRK